MPPILAKTYPVCTTSFLPIPYDIQRNQRSYLEHGISNLKRTADKLQTEIKHWQDIYVRQGERPIISYHAATRTHIRVAVSAVIDVNNVVTTVVILPRQKEGTETSPCEIILTMPSSRRSNPNTDSNSTRKNEARALKNQESAKLYPCARLTKPSQAFIYEPCVVFLLFS